jgi:hypothetical protein
MTAGAPALPIAVNGGSLLRCRAPGLSLKESQAIITHQTLQGGSPCSRIPA